MDYAAMSDAQLLRLPDSSDAVGQLVVRYMPTVTARASAFRLDGCELEDLCQEGLIGLVGAMRSFDDSLGVPFRAYAIMCIDRRIHSCVRHALCKGQVPSASKFLPDSWEDIGSGEPSPELRLIAKEAIDNLRRRIDSVATQRERSVLALYLRGRTYRDIAAELGCTEKSVDSTMQRIRRKLQPRI